LNVLENSSTNALKKNITDMVEQYRAFGDRMVLVEWPGEISPEINGAVHRLAAALAHACLPGVEESVPSYCALGIIYNPLKTTPTELVARLKAVRYSEVPDTAPPRRVEIPVCYGQEMGPDLEYVAHTHGLSVEEVIALHSGALYRVYMIGFTPGFPYLGGLPEALVTPRMETPRLTVPAGAVAIGGRHTGIYPVESPGGWRIIGQTPLHLFDVHNDEPCLLRPADEVAFRPISPAQYAELATQLR
jgi:inhibitor of KinA